MSDSKVAALLMPGARNVPAGVTIVDVLRWRAREHPDDPAFTFLEDGITPSPGLTYQNLDRQARAIGAFLQSRLQPGDRVILCFPEGIAFIAAFFGCLYAGMIAVPAPPLDSTRLRRTISRLQGIVEDALPALLIAPVPSEQLSTALPTLAQAYTEEIPEYLADAWQPPASDNDLAYLQYTSGSTTMPKGVMIRHQSMLYNLLEIQEACGFERDSVTVNWMPQFHDYGLVDGILRPVLHGIPCYFFSPRSFVRRPVLWLASISTYRASHSGAAAFAYDYCVERIAAHELDGIDLSHWKFAPISAEPVHPRTLRTFSERFAPVGFRRETFLPAYGMAEVTAFATAQQWRDESTLRLSSLDAPEGRELTGCGRPFGKSQVLIVDPERCLPCLDQVPGEIWLAGPSVAGGYWNRPEESQRTFQAYRADTSEGPFLRTGDVGFLHQGALFITSRLKNVLIVHGENYAAEDIEWIVRGSHPALEKGTPAVFSIPSDHGDHVVVVFELERAAWGLDPEVLRGAMRQAVADYFGLPLYGIVLAKRGAIPRTSSSKLQRLVCREAYLAGTLTCFSSWTLDEAIAGPAAAPRDGLEATLAELWRELLGVPTVRSDDNFFSLGGDSLSALELTIGVEQKFGQTIPSEFFYRPTLAHLVNLIEDAPIMHQGPADTEVVPVSGQHISVLVSGVSDPPADSSRMWLARHRAKQWRQHVKQRFLRVPFATRRRWGLRLFGLRLSQETVYRHQTGRIRQYLHCLDLTSTAVQRALAIILMENSRLASLFAASTPSSGEASPTVIVSGLEAVEALRGQRGVILVTFHHQRNRAMRIATSGLGFEPIVDVSTSALRALMDERYPGSPSSEFIGALPMLTAILAQQARMCLLQHGLVRIAVDGNVGTGPSDYLPVGRGWFPIKRGFANLGLHTGAAIIPISQRMDDEGRLHLTFGSELAPGHEDLPYAERVDKLLAQLAEFVFTSLRRSPESLALQQMYRFLPSAPLSVRGSGNAATLGHRQQPSSIDQEGPLDVL